jgi:hypothetical protein
MKISVKFASGLQNVCKYYHSNHPITASSSCNYCKKNTISETISKEDKITDKDQHNIVTLNESDHTDLSVILNQVFPECQPNMTKKFKSQKMALERNPHGRRWDKDIARLCLTLWCRSPRGYNELKNSKFMILPSQKILQRYKNTVDQVLSCELSPRNIECTSVGTSSK